MLNRTAATEAGSGPDAAALAGLYREHYLSLVRVAIQLVDDQASAEDLVQDVFTRLQRSSLRDIAYPRRYLITAVVNQARSVLRRRRVSRLSLVDREEPVEAADGQALRDATSAAIWKAITRLPARQRQVVVLRYYADWSIPEIATALGVSRGAASSSLDRALNALTAPIGALDADR